MPEKVQLGKKRVNLTDSKQFKDEEVGVVVEKLKPIFYGVATTKIVLESSLIEKGEMVEILEGNGDQWLTDQGLVSKHFLLLKEV